MKKFLAVLVAIVVVVCIGLTTYYFLRNDEVISFNTTEIYCNIGDKITIQQLGKSVKRESNKTTYDYNAGGEEVTNHIQFDEKAGYYVVNDTNGGDVELVIKTSNENYSEFKILVHIGDGSETNPFYISNATEFASIGTGIFGLSKNYMLMSNITLGADFMPIGTTSGAETNYGFTGTFDGNGYTISGLNLTGTDYLNAGLFTKLTGATISELKINAPIVNGSYLTAGALAGTITNSNVTKVAVIDANITNNMTSQTFVGALAGAIEGVNSNVNLSYATGTVSGTRDVCIGGFAGLISEASVQSTYAETEIIVAEDATETMAGGFAGAFRIGASSGTIRESYAYSSSDYINFASFISNIMKVSEGTDIEKNKLTYLIGNYVYTSNDKIINVNDLDELAEEGQTFELYNSTKEIYMVVPITSWSDIQALPIFYAVNGKVTYWSELNWTLTSGQPTLKIDSGNTTISQVSSEYFRKDLNTEIVNNQEAFISLIESAKASGNTIENKKYALSENLTIDVSSMGEWTPITLINSVIDFNGATITGLTLSNGVSGEDQNVLLGMFSKIQNSAVKNLTIDGVTISGNATYAGALAGVVNSVDANLGVSSIENVNVTYADSVNSTIENLGGLVGRIDNGTIIENSSVANMNTNSSANITNVAGLVAVVNDNLSSISNCEVNIGNDGYLYATNGVAGLVVVNNGILNNNSGSIKVAYNRNDVVGDINVAGLVAENNGSIVGGEYVIDINIDMTNQVINVAGITTTNNGRIENITLTGEGISIKNVLADAVYVGGLVVNNNGAIDNGYNLMESVGTYYEGKNFVVGGIAVYNSNENSSIRQVIAGSNVYGNTVAGVVVEMNNRSAQINQVLVAGFDTSTDTITAKEIKGDKYVAGVAYDLSAGLITNVQAQSNLVGATNTTRTSLIVLIFPDGAKLNNSSINSTLDGNGTFYRETWADYDSTKPFGSISKNANFNLFAVNSAAGEMQGVVINTEKAGEHGISTINASFITEYFGSTCSYVGDENSSFFKTVNNADFINYTTYTSNCVITALSGWWQTTDYSFAMKFDFNGTWSNTIDGINLAFVYNI